VNHLRRFERPELTLALLLGVVTLAIYLPSLGHDFLQYDDQEYVTANLHVSSGLTPDGFVWAFGNHVSNWHPLTWLSHMLDCQLYGLRPAGHHFTNILLHAVNVVLLFLLLRRITGAVWRSACVAALFAWHPLHVESVAWIAERKDLLSGLFFMLTLLSYSGYVQSRNARVEEGREEREEVRHHASRITYHESRSYALTLLLFALGLMSKPMLVTLPFVLLLLDYWPLGRFTSVSKGPSLKSVLALVLEKVPFLVLAAADCVLTLSAQRESFSVVSAAGLPIGQRLAHTLVAYAHYIVAMFVPRHLAVFYPYETPSTLETLGAGLLLGLLTLGAILAAKRRVEDNPPCQRRRYLLVGWLWYLGMLVPVIGLVQVGDQAWADRYTYLPLLGLFIALVWGGAELLTRRAQPRTGPQALASSNTGTQPGAQSPTQAPILFRLPALALTLLLLLATFLQLRYWKNTWTLFEHAARVTHNNYRAVAVLGSLLAAQGRLDEAKEHYALALSYKQGYAEAHFLLGDALLREGQLDQAINHLRQALRFKPMQEQTHLLLGTALGKQNKYDEAAAQYHAALELNSDSAAAHNNLGRLLHAQGKFDGAFEHYAAAIKLAPDFAEVHNNVGILLLQQGKAPQAITQLREAVRLNPASRDSEYNLALALNRQQGWAEAASLFAKTVDGANPDANAHYEYGLALAHLGKTPAARSEYAQALLLQPEFMPAMDGLAWILATSPKPELRNGEQAVALAERACFLTQRKDADKLKTLAAAYAEAGRFGEAVQTVQEATDKATTAGNTALASHCRLMLEGFKKNSPWREPVANP
jgi:tetratricopeptide (TPR) repeat protein